MEYVPTVTGWLANRDVTLQTTSALPLATFSADVAASNRINEYPLTKPMIEHMLEDDAGRPRAERWEASSRLVKPDDAGGDDDAVLPKKVQYIKVCSPWWCKEMAVDEDPIEQLHSSLLPSLNDVSHCYPASTTFRHD